MRTEFVVVTTTSGEAVVALPPREAVDLAGALFAAALASAEGPLEELEHTLRLLAAIATALGERRCERFEMSTRTLQ